MRLPTIHITSQNLRRWVSCAMALVLVLSIVIWYDSNRLKSTIVLATAKEGGQYQKFGELLQKSLKNINSETIKVELRSTAGSLDNYDLLKDGDVDLIIIQGGAVDLTEYKEGRVTPAVIAPLYPEVLHVVVRKNRGIQQLTDLTGRKMILGEKKSGMRKSARTLTDHYKLIGPDEGKTDYFGDFESILEADAAIVTTGVLNKDLNRLLGSGHFVLLPIDDANALQMRNPYFSEFTVPKGLYGEQPSVPKADVSTLATTAFLVGGRETSDALTDLLLQAIYEEGMRLKMPTLYTRAEAKGIWKDLPIHDEARSYFEPQDEIGHLASIMESLAATKELLFALIAAIYLIWERWKRLKEKEERAELKQQKDHLDGLLTRTLEIESKQIGITDEKLLRQLLDDVTRVKLQALEELTHEELRGDRSFLIFLTQSSALSSKIQAKISDSQWSSS